MPIDIERQKRLVEVGKIRVGETYTTSTGKTAPRARETFRLTSRHKDILFAAQESYGGTVRQWEGHPGYFELLIDSREIKALVSLRRTLNGEYESLSQHFERWGGTRKCTHRCNGLICSLLGADGRKDVPCQCDPQDRKCKLVSRLLVLLTELPALGMWRLDTRSDTFDSEVHALIDVCSQFNQEDRPIPVTLAITWREKSAKTDKEDEKPERFAVVSVTLDPNPVSTALMLSRIQEKAIGGLSEPPGALPEGPKALESPMTDYEWLTELLGIDGVRDFSAWASCEDFNPDSTIAGARQKGVDSVDVFWAGAQKALEVQRQAKEAM